MYRRTGILPLYCSTAVVPVPDYTHNPNHVPRNLYRTMSETTSTPQSQNSHQTPIPSMTLILGCTASGKGSLRLPARPTHPRPNPQHRLHEGLPTHGHWHRQARPPNPQRRQTPPHRRPRALRIMQYGTIRPTRRPSHPRNAKRPKTHRRRRRHRHVHTRPPRGHRRRPRRRPSKSAPPLKAQADQHGSAALHQKLTEVDPQAALKIHPNDLKRIIRALEFHQLTGQPISARQQQFRSGNYRYPMADYRT